MGKHVPAHLELSQATLQVAGRPPLCPALSVWPEAQPLPSLGLHLAPVMGKGHPEMSLHTQVSKAWWPQIFPHLWGQLMVGPPGTILIGI